MSTSHDLDSSSRSLHSSLRSSSSPTIAASSIGSSSMDRGEDPKEKGKTSGKRFWKENPTLRKDFIDKCLEEIDKCGYLGGSLQVQSWARMVDTLTAKYPEISFNQKMLKNHWDTLKKKYLIWRSLVSKSGHSFISERELLNWPDSAWIDLIKENKEATQFRKAPLEFSKELAKIFDGITQEHVSTLSTPVREQVSSGAGPSRTGSSKRKRMEASMDPVMEQLIGLVSNQFEFVKQKRDAELEEDSAYSVCACMDMITSMKTYLDISDEIVERAIVKFCECAKYRKAFIELEEQHKLVLLRGLSRS